MAIYNQNEINDECNFFDVCNVNHHFVGCHKKSFRGECRYFVELTIAAKNRQEKGPNWFNSIQRTESMVDASWAFKGLWRHEF